VIQLNNCVFQGPTQIGTVASQIRSQATTLTQPFFADPPSDPSTTSFALESEIAEATERSVDFDAKRFLFSFLTWKHSSGLLNFGMLGLVFILLFSSSVITTTSGTNFYEKNAFDPTQQFVLDSIKPYLHSRNDVFERLRKIKQHFEKVSRSGRHQYGFYEKERPFEIRHKLLLDLLELYGRASKILKNLQGKTISSAYVDGIVTSFYEDISTLKRKVENVHQSLQLLEVQMSQLVIGEDGNQDLYSQRSTEATLQFIQGAPSYTGSGISDMLVNNMNWKVHKIKGDATQQILKRQRNEMTERNQMRALDLIGSLKIEVPFFSWYSIEGSDIWNL